MPNAREIHEGMGILLSTVDPGGDLWMAAEHDIISFPGAEPSQLSPEQVRCLERATARVHKRRSRKYWRLCRRHPDPWVRGYLRRISRLYGFGAKVAVKVLS